jgi:RNA polymerase sigma-70 factor (ECF subfamily)
MQLEPISQWESAAIPPSMSSRSCEVDEKNLVAEAKDGSIAAFEQLVEMYQARIFRLARTFAHCHEDAEEIMQNAFVQAYKNLPYFRGESRFYTWLVRITINQGLMKARRRHLNTVSIDQTAETEDYSYPTEIEDWGPTPEQRYSREQVRVILATGIAKLAPIYRTVFQLRDVEGLTTQETARALTLTPSAVKARLGRARLQLRNSLNKYFKPVSVRRSTPHQERVISLPAA